MMKAQQQLIKGERNSVGNHRREDKGNTTKFFYHQTAICTVNWISKFFLVDNGGWATSSTSRAINGYRKYFEDLGFNELKK